MVQKRMLFGFIPIIVSIMSCSSIKVIETGELTGDDNVPVEIKIIPGEHYKHKMKINSFIKITNVPQMAVWVEDSENNFITTVFITNRSANQSWRGTPGEDKGKGEVRRASALPLWSHHRGVQYEDGLYMPTKENPMPDAVSSATPKDDFIIKSKIPEQGDLWIYLEVNSSTDFNEAYSADAPEGSKYYSGGKFESGQPALVYRCKIDRTELNSKEPFSKKFELIGHSSPDGSDGKIYSDMEGITSAFEIIEEAVISKK
ncbi:MAG: hypothetical protein PQJ46_13000 [Spirochaetales bacterium]|nr:hypothetical protein [Spirochaetales bacterium]